MFYKAGFPFSVVLVFTVKAMPLVQGLAASAAHTSTNPHLHEQQAAMCDQETGICSNDHKRPLSVTFDYC